LFSKREIVAEMFLGRDRILMETCRNIKIDRELKKYYIGIKIL
jgi:hypothetical protein